MKVGFITLGCDKNTVDTERYLGDLAHCGGEYTADLADAEVIIVNTCGFIDAAKKEAHQVSESQRRLRSRLRLLRNSSHARTSSLILSR